MKKLSMEFLELTLELGDYVSTFNLEKAICNHGYFMMAPNRWVPSTKTLIRPLRLADSSTSVTVSICHPPGSTFLLIRLHGVDNLRQEDREAILKQVSRMLRISEKDERNVREFQELHPHAKERNFGRIFRSPTLFEDIVKSMLLCNCTWRRTLDMCKALCQLQPDLVMTKNSKKRKRRKLEVANSSVSDFPIASELAMLDRELLNDRCKLGYRADLIIAFAKKVASGNLKLDTFDGFDQYNPKAFKSLLKIKGVGSFTSASILMCIGFYHHIPVDSETIRHIKETHGTTCNNASIQKIYGKYAPFESLAYWLELLEAYEKKFGKLSELKHEDYSIVSSSFYANSMAKQSD